MSQPSFDQELDFFFDQVLDLPLSDQDEFIFTLSPEFQDPLRSLVKVHREMSDSFLEPVLQDAQLERSRPNPDHVRNKLFLQVGCWTGMLSPSQAQSVSDRAGDENGSWAQRLCEERGFLDPNASERLNRMVEDWTALHGGDLQSRAFEGTLAFEGLSQIADRNENRGPQKRYDILRHYEDGGIGQILVGHDRELNRDVAVKELQDKCIDDERARQRFEREAIITGQLEHPGIVPIYGFGMIGERPYYAMKLIQGDNLKVRLRAHHEQAKAGSVFGYEFRELLRRFITVCETVEFANSRGVLHRDLKPSNVMIGEYGETLVVDWGSAVSKDELAESGNTAPAIRTTELSATRMGSVIGTPQYMSPEQASGKTDQLTKRSDVYSLGAVLYEIISGKPPIDAKLQDGTVRGVTEVLDAVQKGDISSLGSMNHRVPKPLAAICHKALSKNPDDRYESASQLAQDINRWLADEPVDAYQDPISVRFARWTRKHRSVATASAVGAATIIASLTVLASNQATAAAKLLSEKEKTEQALEVAANMLFALDQKPLHWFRASTSPTIAENEKISIDRIADAMAHQNVIEEEAADIAARRQGVEALFLGLREVQNKTSKDAIPYMDIAAKSLPRARSTAYFTALTRLNAKQYEDAIALSVEAAMEYQNDPDIQRNAAETLSLAAWDLEGAEKRDMLSQATDFALKSLELAPGNVKATLNYCEILMQREEHKRAEAVLQSLIHEEKLVTADQTHKTYIALVYCLGKQGKYEETIELAKMLVELSDDIQSETSRHKGSALYYLGRGYEQAGQLRSASETYKELLRVEPERVDALNNLSVVEIRLGQYAAAAKSLARLTSNIERVDPSKRNNVILNYAVALVGSGESDKGLGIFEQLAPSYDRKWMDYFYCHYQQAALFSGEDAEASRIQQVAAEVDFKPGYAPIHYAICRIQAIVLGDEANENLPFETEWQRLIRGKKRFSTSWNCNFLDEYISGLDYAKRVSARKQLAELRMMIRDSGVAAMESK